MKYPIRVMIVDDHPLARQGLVSILNAFDGRFEIVAQAANAEEALAQVECVHPDIVLTDLHLGSGDARSGIDIIGPIQSNHSDTQFVIITSEVGDAFLLRAYDAGARAFVHKHATAAEIVRALETVASGFTHFPAQLKAALDQRARGPSLTPREAQLLPYVANGMTAKGIARMLSGVDSGNAVNDRTVEVHKGNIKRKFNLDSASALVAFAIEYCRMNRVPYGTCGTRSTIPPKIRRVEK